jgi:heat shock protein HslJ/uncharacterized protein YraI
MEENSMAQQRSSSNTLTIVLATGLALALIGLVVVLVLFVFGDEEESDSGGEEILNTVWQWVKVTNQATGETITVPNPGNYTIVFNPDGTVNIRADCNMVGGSYTLDGNAPDIQLGPSTMAFCGEESLDQQYLELLSNVVAGGPDGAGGLALETAGGEQRMEFQKGGSGAIVPPPGITVVPTRVVPTPEPGRPTGVVIAPAGVNVRTGPGTEYDVILLAPLGAQGEIIGSSPDRTWWVVRVPGAPNDQGWVAAEYVRADNAGGVPVVQPPPIPTPVATRTPVPTAAPDVSFTASRTTINAGETATLSWSVQNVKAVYMFPVGGSPFDYPVTGQGSRDVQPGITTSYELRVINPDDSSSSQRIEIAVIGGLTGGRWVLASYSTPAGGFQNALPGTQVTARFGADGSLSGSGGCNSYNGGFTGFDRALRIHQLAASQALCDSPPGVMDQEATFLSLMRQANSFAISAGQLEVFDAGGNRILVFNNG